MTNNNNNNTIDCDYLVVGGGATGMAFVDTLLKHSPPSGIPKVLMVDKHETPGGQWHDSYGFVKLHQPSSGYGVESRELEPPQDATGNTSNLPTEQRHRASRQEILDYYRQVADDLRSQFGMEFLGGHTLDLAQLDDESTRSYKVTDNATQTTKTIIVRKKIVDARNLEPDLPVSTPPKFGVPSEGSGVSVLPVNDLVHSSSSSNSNVAQKSRFVVIGGGKTGMDAVYHLLTSKKVSPDHLLWVVPNDAWITARENIGNCIDLLYTAAKLHDESSSSAAAAIVNDDADEKKESDASALAASASSNNHNKIGPDFFQRAFLEWEKLGHVYRLDDDSNSNSSGASAMIPTKFKDATLSLDELRVLRKAVPRLVRRGRISRITETGTLQFQDGSSLELPFDVNDTLFVHCSAGAFHCSKSLQRPPPIFHPHKITVQDVYGTPGFCFVGSILGKLESMPELSEDDRNNMALRPLPAAPTTPPQEVSGGDILGPVTHDHPFVQRAQNLWRWLHHSHELRDWVVSNRLFHLVGADPRALEDRLDYVFGVLEASGVAVEEEAKK